MYDMSVETQRSNSHGLYKSNKLMVLNFLHSQNLPSAHCSSQYRKDPHFLSDLQITKLCHKGIKIFVKYDVR